MFFRRFNILRLAFAVMIWLMSAPLSAQPAPDQSNQCTHLGLLIGIVDLTTLIVRNDAQDMPTQFDALEDLAKTIDDFQLHRMLKDAGMADLYPEAQKYISDVSRFISVRRVNGPQYGSWILGTEEFRERHDRMAKLAKDICKLAPVDVVLKSLEQVTAELDPQAKPRKIETVQTGLQTLQNTSPTNSKWSQPFRIRKDVLMLMRVFFILAAIFLCLYGLNQLIRLANAIRLDRYSCIVPATIEVGGLEFSGHIDILGNRGLSFVVTEPADPIHAETLVLDRHVRFITEAQDLHAVLTKEFDGSAGFRLAIPLRRSALKAILAISETKPHRKLETRKKKKPAVPIKASLA